MTLSADGVLLGSLLIFAGCKAEDDDAVEGPQARIQPTSGELFYAQIGLGGLSMGESALVIGPDGTRVLIDAGNDAHDDDIAELLDTLIEQMNTGGGYAGAPFPLDSLDDVLITHFHADHADGLQDLLDHLTLSGRVVHRGFFDLTDAANDGTVKQLCNTLADHPGVEEALCEGAEAAPCSPSEWSGSYPETSCEGTTLALGGGAELQIIGVNGWMAGHDYEQEVGPLRSRDSNGENARSVTGVLAHGAFRMLFAGDLTGGGSDTDPVESFYVDWFADAWDFDRCGVDVLHAGHHGRNTSSSLAWVDALLPADGADRNAVMGISTAHLGSPHAEVLHTLLDDGRLGEGRAWTTTVAPGGATHERLVDAGGGSILLTTVDGGAGYVVQAIDKDGDVLESRAFHSVHSGPQGECP